MLKNHRLDDKITILERLKQASKDISLDDFCGQEGISRRTLSRWANSDDTRFDLRKRVWLRHPNSLANLNRGDYSAAGERLYLSSTHRLRSAAWLSSQQHTCAACRWTDCPVRQEGESDCLVLAERQNELEQELSGHPHVDETSSLARQWIIVNLNLTMTEIARRGLEGDISEHFEIYQGVQKFEAKNRDQLIRLSESLLLSPDAIRRAKVAQSQIMDVASRAAALRGEKE